MKKMGGRHYQLWDEEDGFFYDVLRYPDGSFEKFRVRSLVGLIPLYAVERLEDRWIEPFQEFRANLHWFLDQQDARRPGRLPPACERDGQTCTCCAIVDEAQMKRLLRARPRPRRVPVALRPAQPVALPRANTRSASATATVRYEPAEAESQIKGGNSNWRGPVWFPTSFLMIESLRKLGTAYGPTLTRARATATAVRAARCGRSREDLANRIIRIFTRDADGPPARVTATARKFQDDPHWRDLLLFHEYFHGETGEGLGASHQTGWTALVASLIDEWRRPPQPSSR